MANRINWYILLRQIHRYAAFIVLVFLVMYFVTGYLLVRENWFDKEEPVQEIKHFSFSKMPDFEDASLATYLKKEWAIEGKYEGSWEEKDEVKAFEFLSLRRENILRVDKKKKTATLTSLPHNEKQTVKLWHRLHGYGQSLPYNILAFMMDLASLSLFIFVLTGVIIWMKLVKYRALGWIFLSLGLIYTLFVIGTFLWR